MQNRAKFSDIVKYSFGGIGSNMPFMLIMMYLTYFYTDVFGISALAAAGLMLVARIIDTVTDPLMGMIADNTKSKLGRFRPYIIFGAPLLGLTMFLLFSTPSLSPTAKIVYAYIVYIAYSLASTVVNIPYHSLTSVMSDDAGQRTVIVSWKQGMSIFPQFLISLSLPIVTFFGGNSTSTLGWSVYGAIAGIVTTIAFWICAWGGKPYDTMDRVPAQQKKKNTNVLSDLKFLIKNKPLLMLLIAFGTDLFAASISNAVNTYYFKYILHLESWIPTVSMLTMVVSIAAIFLVAPLAKKFGKKSLSWWTSLLCIVPNLVLILVPNPVLAVVATMLSAYGFTTRITSTLAWAMLPDCVDWGEWKFAKRIDGLTTSTMTFMNKLSSALAGSLAMAVLGVMGFVANQEQTTAVCGAIMFMRFAVPILGHIATLISLFFYELTESRIKQINEELAARHVGDKVAE